MGFIIYLICVGFSALASWGVMAVLVDWLGGQLPEAMPVLEEARRYGWAAGLMVGLLVFRGVLRW